MEHVFVSHATADREVAEEITAHLEREGVSCWMAPRDIPGGDSWLAAISEAISKSRLMLVVFSSAADSSPWVEREVARAVELHVGILPVKIEDVVPSKSLAYVFSTIQLMAVCTPPVTAHLPDLVARVRRLLDGKPVRLERNGAAPAGRAGGSDQTAGHRKSSQPVTIDELVVNQDQPPPVAYHGSYDLHVTRERPASIILLLDQSGSMNRRIGGMAVQKKVAVADGVNRLLYNCVLTASREDGVRPYYYFGLIAYGVPGGVASVFGQDFGRDLLSISEIADNAKRPGEPTASRHNGTRGTVEEELPMPIWFEPSGGGQTLMNAAFQRALTMVTASIHRFPHSFPPIVINVTDGGWTDENPSATVREIEEQATEVGNALVFNCHVSEVAGQSLLCPGPSEIETLDPKLRRIYDLSSLLPATMREFARGLGFTFEEGARGYVHNADFYHLVAFLDIGTKGLLDSAKGAGV